MVDLFGTKLDCFMVLMSKKCNVAKLIPSLGATFVATLVFTLDTNALHTCQLVFDLIPVFLSQMLKYNTFATQIAIKSW